jgi:bifunctional non-homologous end joining protein LigD
VAPFILPYLRKRPLSLQRYPDGIEHESFFSKNAPVGMPDWVRTVKLKSDAARGSTAYVVCDDEPTLAYVANLAAITLHVWFSHVGSLENPDFVLFDLDPGDRCPLARLGGVALHLQKLLRGIGLEPIVKTTGGKGLHVLVPLAPGHTYDAVKRFGEMVARRMLAQYPRDITLERSKAARPRDAVYFDYLQIGRGKTMVAPWSVRALPKAPVSTPIAWTHVGAMSRSRAKDTPTAMRRWNLKNTPALLRRTGDPWRTAFARGQRLAPAITRAASEWESDGRNASDASAGGAPTRARRKPAPYRSASRGKRVGAKSRRSSTR